MSAQEATPKIPPKSVLLEQFELPAGLHWFNELGSEARDEFFKGLMIVLTAPRTEWQSALESHFRHWQMAVDVAVQQGQSVLDVIRVYRPKPRRTIAELLAEVKQELCAFEREYNMTSAEFYRKFQSGELEEGPWDYFEWRAAYSGYLLMKRRYSLL